MLVGNMEPRQVQQWNMKQLFTKEEVNSGEYLHSRECRVNIHQFYQYFSLYQTSLKIYF